MKDSIKYHPALDGARGWVSIGVLIAHVNLSWLTGILTLMELFFVISGFLITSIILIQTKTNKNINLLTFWKHRLMRLYPVLIVVVVTCTSIASLATDHAASSLNDAIATLLYVSNLTKLNDQIYPTIFAQTWSLAIEEQFYIIWPLIFWILFTFKIKIKHVSILLTAISITCIVWKQYLIYTDAQWSRLYYATDTRMDAFIIGGLVAIHHSNLLKIFNKAILFSILKASILLYFFIISFGTPRSLDYFQWQQPMTVILSAALVLLTTSDRESFFKWLLSTRLSVYLGQRSYSIYLWHWPIIWLLSVIFNPSKPLLLIIVLPITLVLSDISYRFIERPFMLRRKSLRIQQEIDYLEKRT
ncbi:acyltransferase family protein [Venatoribacter cucullus]|uniref:acyltransferase family protein n=1 Tax=Venatoribacter cucullus TaxID=2661630 RepID=UPI002240CB45|nr:acyltransferase [Venatoribacter cucullus]UZK03165.1 acyltransferase family protein [Venatoribacter cucullus]